MSTAIQTREFEDIAILTLDDDKANAMQRSWCEDLHAALDEVESGGCSAVVIAGRPGFFSGGLDLKLLPTLSSSEIRAVTDLFVETMRRVFLFPRPVVAASTGHAVAGGMMLLLASDIRLGLDDDRYRYGLNEAVTGVPLLGGTVGICQYGIPSAHHTEVILQGRMLSARQCFERQILHELAATHESLVDRAIERARVLSDLDLAVYGTNKLILRREAFDAGVRIAKSLISHAPKHNVFEKMKR